MSQNKMILEHLQAGHSISPLEALQEYGSFRLAARINDLKNQGHAIVSRSKKVATRQNGMVTVAEYFLERRPVIHYWSPRTIEDMQRENDNEVRG